MKTFFLALALISSSAFADGDNCSIGRQVMKGVLSAKSPLMKKHTPGKVTGSVKKGFGFSEKGQLTSGVKVVYTIGGCEHLGRTFHYTNYSGADVTTKSGVIEAAKKLITATPVKADSDVSTFVEALEAAKTSPAKLENGILNIPCGDADCNVDVTEKDHLELTYSFAI